MTMQRASRQLGVSRYTLYRILREYKAEDLVEIPTVHLALVRGGKLIPVSSLPRLLHMSRWRIDELLDRYKIDRVHSGRSKYVSSLDISFLCA